MASHIESTEGSHSVTPVDPLDSSAVADSDSSHHVNRDYSYVWPDVRYIALIVVLILISLLSTAASLRWI